MPDSSSDDAQCYSREHIGIVSLPRNKCLSIFQSHTLKRTSTGKDSSTLKAGRKPVMGIGLGAVMAWGSFFIFQMLDPSLSASKCQHCGENMASTEAYLFILPESSPSVSPPLRLFPYIHIKLSESHWKVMEFIVHFYTCHLEGQART